MGSGIEMIRTNDNLRQIARDDKIFAIFETLLSIKSILEERLK